jgi:ABC-type phosphate transport system substrate-binding protein
MVRRAVSRWWGIAALLALGLTVGIPLPGAITSGDVAIVVNSRVPVTDLSFTELRRILLGERQFWSSSLRISLLMRAPVAREREVLLNTVYEMSEAQVRQYWISKVFRAEAPSAPPLFYSDEEILQALAAVPGSIAAVEASRIPKSLRVIRIDGHLPGEPGYRLR